MRFDPVRSPLSNMRVWGAQISGYSFCITEELDNKDPEWCGYTASWKALNADMKPFGKQPANRIDGGPWKRFRDAERACVRTLKQLRAKQ